MFGYIGRSAATLMRLFVLFEPLRFFSTIAAILMLAGTGIGARFLYYYFTGQGGGKIQSLILAAILLIIGFNVFVIGLLSNNLATNRKLFEDCLYRVRAMEHDRPWAHSTDPRSRETREPEINHRRKE